MEAVATGFIEKGVLGLVIVALATALGILWKHLIAERNASTERLQRLQEQQAKEREELQEQHAKEREALVNDSRQANTETLDRVYTLTRDVTKTTERVTAVVEENTKAIKDWGCRIDTLGNKIITLDQRVERLEGKQ